MSNLSTYNPDTGCFCDDPVWEDKGILDGKYLTQRCLTCGTGEILPTAGEKSPMDFISERLDFSPPPVEN